MDNLDIKKLRAKYGEAFYVLLPEQYIKNFIELKEAFSKIYHNFNIAYSYKTNYIPQLCKIVNDLGGYAEVVSEMEMELALKVGVPYDRIIWNGPIKNPVVVEEYLLNGGLINIDNFDEFKMVKCIISKYPSVIFRLGVRCNYDVEDDVISRFGFDINGEEFEEVINCLKNSNNVKIISFQCHFAKRQVEYWPARVKGMINLIDRIGIIPERIDLGGALFGKMPPSLIKQFPSKIPSYDEYASIAAKPFFERFGDSGPELIIEPGSALVGDCMKFIATVKSIKCIRGKYIATILGSQKNISMSGVNPPMEIINSSDTPTYYDNIDLVGYTCIEGDVIYKGYKGTLSVGDTVVISNCGSYSVVMKPPFILPNFPIVSLFEKQDTIIKRAETFDDVFNTYIF